MSSFRYRPEILEGLPTWLTSELKQYEDWFVIETPELNRITDHFVKELEKGLTKEGGNIVGPLSLWLLCEMWRYMLIRNGYCTANERHLGDEIPKRRRGRSRLDLGYGWNEPACL